MKNRMVGKILTGLLEGFSRIHHARNIASTRGWGWEIDEEEIKKSQPEGSDNMTKKSCCGIEDLDLGSDGTSV